MPMQALSPAQFEALNGHMESEARQRRVQAGQQSDTFVLPPKTADAVPGLPVAGYQPQSTDNVALVNANKVAEEKVLRIMDGLQKLPDVDPRWLALARTHLELGFMAMNRSIFRPKRLEGDLE